MRRMETVIDVTNYNPQTDGALPGWTISVNQPNYVDMVRIAPTLPEWGGLTNYTAWLNFSQLSGTNPYVLFGSVPLNTDEAINGFTLPVDIFGGVYNFGHGLFVESFGHTNGMARVDSAVGITGRADDNTGDYKSYNFLNHTINNLQYVEFNKNGASQEVYTGKIHMIYRAG